jgi:NADH dehydrogenase
VKIAITGGTGFAGRHLARALLAEGHEVTLIARGVDRRDESVRNEPGARFMQASTVDEDALATAFAGCDGIAHFAGINREIGQQTYARVHVEGTRAVLAAARRAGVRKVLYLSFLRARPDCGSGYHESKWAAEELVRRSGLDYTVFKASVLYGRGDHMLEHLSRAFYTFPVFPLVGLRDRPIRPTRIHDLARVARSALVDGRLSGQTVAVMGPEELTLTEALRRVARATGRRPRFVRLPVAAHYLFAWWFERLMTTPLLSLAQVRILAEGVSEPAPPCDRLPVDLAPATPFTETVIRAELPAPGRFRLDDLRLFAHHAD